MEEKCCEYWSTGKYVLMLDEDTGTVEEGDDTEGESSLGH